MNKFPAVGLLAYAERERPDPLGAVAAVDKLNTLLNIKVNTSELAKNAKEIEEEINRQLAPMEEKQGEDQFTSRRIYT